MRSKYIFFWAAFLFLLPLVSLGQSKLFIDKKSVWKYLDAGLVPATKNWLQHSYADTGWKAGSSEFGFGDGDENAVLKYGKDSLNKAVTYYFRKTFDAGRIKEYKKLRLAVLADDGFIIYLNGKEIIRNNLPLTTINNTTRASSEYDSLQEKKFTIYTLDTSSFTDSINIICAEVHLHSTTDDDMSFAAELRADSLFPKNKIIINRNPYLQLSTESGVTFRWRTVKPTVGKIWYSKEYRKFADTIAETFATTEHSLAIKSLLPATKYFYNLGYDNTVLAGDDSSFYFKTNPVAGSVQPFRMWVLGDPGTADTNQRRTRNGFLKFNKNNSPDIWLSLGDNGYPTGTDATYLKAFFENMYEEIHRNTTLWQCYGNHDAWGGANAHTGKGSYFNVFDMPMNGEAGGVSSGHEAYYSFDYANTHFICLDAMDMSRDSTDTMAIWLRNDLASTQQNWIIAYWHHPPYSKGSHNSDTESNMVEMRKNILPILERYNTDLILTGHSHSYERSMMLNGHYDSSKTFIKNTMAVDSTMGFYPDSGCAYTKKMKAPGTVYAVCGTTGSTIKKAALNHPVMVKNFLEFGTLVLDVNDNRIDYKFIDSTGKVLDKFTIIKEAGKRKDTTICAADSTLLKVKTSWPATEYLTNGNKTYDRIFTPQNLKSGVNTFLVTDINGCLKDTFNITLKPSPKIDLGKDTVLKTGDSILLDAGQQKMKTLWHNGDTSHKIYVNKPGKYFATVTDKNGCTASDTILISAQTQVVNYEKNPFDFNIYQLSASDEFIVETNFESLQQYTLTIRTAEGKHIRTLTSNSHHIRLYLTGCSKGFYLAELRTGNKMRMKKFIFK